MSMVLMVAYYHIHFIVIDDSFFNFVKDGGGGYMAIVVYNPIGFCKRAAAQVYDDRVKY